MRAANLLAGQMLVVCLAAAVVLCACGDDDSSEGDPDAGTDSDADSDSDSDGDPDTWAVQISGPEDEVATAVAYLSDGSLVVAGWFAETIMIGDSEAELTSAGGEDIFVTRIGAEGEVMWAARAGGSTFAHPYEMAVLADDSILITGEFADTITLGEGEPNETELSGGDGMHWFAAGYNDDGTLAWAERIDWTDESIIRAFPEADGSVFLWGTFVSSALLDEGGPNETELLGPGSEDYYLARFSPSGAFDWAVSVTRTNEGCEARFDPQPDGSLVCGASEITDGPLVFNYGGSDETTFPGPASVLARFDSGGSLVWAAETLLPEAPYANSARFTGGAALDDGSLVGAGVMYFGDGDEITFGAGEPNETVLAEEPGTYMMVGRYAADGAFEWINITDHAGPSQSASIATAGDQSLLVFGVCIGVCTFDVGGPNETMADISYDFAAKYDAAGAFEHVWHAVSSTGGMAYESSYMAAGPNDTFALVGKFTGEVSFWGDEPDPITLTSGGNDDAFVVQQSY